MARTRTLDRTLRSTRASYDAVFQVGGLFAPFVGDFPTPVALFCDYTTKLAELNYPPWFGLSGSMAQRWNTLERGLYHSSRIILTASSNTKRSFIDDFGVDANRVIVVAEGVDEVHEHPGKTFTEQTILFVGIDFPRKGGATLLKAFRTVRRQHPAARLWIVGPEAGEPEEGVSWLGRVGREKLNGLFERATVFAMPSICEPFGLAMIEAMSHGLPVVGSTVDAMSEIVDEGKSGFLVPPCDPVALADRLEWILSNPALAKTMGEIGQEKVRARFLWTQVINRVEAALALVL